MRRALQSTQALVAALVLIVLLASLAAYLVNIPLPVVAGGALVALVLIVAGVRSRSPRPPAP